MDWIDVKDKRPSNNIVCLVYNKSRPFRYYIALYDNYSDEFQVSMVSMILFPDPVPFNATHWCEIIQPKD